MQRTSLGAFAKRHHLGLSLCGIVAACAVILPACGTGGSPFSPIAAPDLSIAKAGVVSGNTVTYTITVTNNGTVSASVPIVMQDTLPTAPAGVLFSGATGSSSTCSGLGAGPIVCTSNTALAAGGQLTYIITLTVPASGGTVTNCASVTQGSTTGTSGETNLANNRGCAANTIVTPVAPDLSITKVGVVSGNTVTYTITATNNGTVAAPGPIVMQDSLPLAPSGVLFSAATGSSSTCSGVGTGPIVCTSTTALAAGGQLTYTITLTVPASGGTVTNCASVTRGVDAATPLETNLTNNRACATNTVSPAPAPDLSIAKVGVVSGNTVTYTITVTNNGTLPAPGPIVMQDTLPTAPAGVSFSGATGSSSTCSGLGAGPIACTSSTALAPSGQLTYTITLTVPASGSTVTNCASVTQGSTTGTPGETNLANNRACVTNIVLPAPAPDLSITKVGVVSGNTVTYTITVTNNGTLPTPGSIVMQDSLPSVPAGVLFSASGSTCSGFGAVPCLWSYSTPLAPGAQLIYTVTLVVPASGGTVTNCASVTQGLNAGTPGEADLTNNRACATNIVLPAPAPDLSITKVGVVSGNTVTYTITVTNNGTVPALVPIVMQDTLPSAPAGVSFSGATGSSSTCSGLGAGPIVCTSNAVLAPGGQLTYTITLTVPAGGAGGPGGGTVTNCASVRQRIDVVIPDETNLANNRACATNTIVPPTGTLTIVKHAQSFDTQVFHFTTTGGGGLIDFDLDDNGNNTDALSNSKTFTLPAGGPYSVTEAAVTGWTVTVINCTQTGAQNSNVTGNVPGITVTVGSGGNVICTFENARVALGTIVVNATLASGAGSAPWTGSVSFTLTGPQTITGTSASQTFASVPVGTYTLTYTSGGPPGATLNSVTPSVTQTLTAGNTLTFTLNFR
jgi:uncharacterized repeat protein (TIGR01451 family)